MEAHYMFAYFGFFSCPSSFSQPEPMAVKAANLRMWGQPDWDPQPEVEAPCCKHTPVSVKAERGKPLILRFSVSTIAVKCCQCAVETA